MNFPSIEDMQYADDATLRQLYHHAQIACIDFAVNKDFVTAYNLITLAVNARFTVMSRYGFDDDGHIRFYNECVEQRDNLFNFIFDLSRPLFNFTSGRLVGNAMDAGISVPKSFRPVGWKYYRDYVEVYHRPRVNTH